MYCLISKKHKMTLPDQEEVYSLTSSVRLNMSKTEKIVAVFGASGFVGKSILCCLRDLEAETFAFSRKTVIPSHLNHLLIQRKMHWMKYEEKDPFKDKVYDSVIISIGSPPLPTLSQEAYDRKVYENGHIPSKIIEAAERIGIKKVVLVNAHLPSLTPSAYRDGKLMARNRVKEFAQKEGSTGIVVCPNVIYGIRNEIVAKTEIPIPLTPVLWPMNLALKGLKATGISNKLESTFPSVLKNTLDPFVKVSDVGLTSALAAVTDEYENTYKELLPKDINLISTF
eukprot:snap_masked-scaffold_16-processed-gene-0.35-mRNA-1 protein AED:1.00 eAED:1.00 QI:0/0/0/0/1/1/3/0/282